MNAALLCPGPSLVEFPKRHSYGMVVGVNRAASFRGCDWWAVQDWQLFLETTPLGNPAIFTTGACVEAIHRHGGGEQLARRLLRYPADVYFYDDPPRQWSLYTSTMALMLAWDQGAVSIDCYGVDRHGTADWDGVEREQDNRSEGRWAIEADLWAGVVNWLSAHGMAVNE